MIQINRVHFPVTTLGYGRRVGIWTQGCSIRCPGCVSKDTWEPRPAAAVEVGELVDSLRDWLAEADGVTISGGGNRSIKGRPWWSWWARCGTGLPETF